MSGRPVIPLCFEADPTPLMHDMIPTETAENQFFRFAPQRSLYPTSASEPTSAAIEAFMREHGIGYIYVDAEHPNVLVPDADVVFEVEGRALLRLP
jgi:hypothetical protein